MMIKNLMMDAFQKRIKMLKMYYLNGNVSKKLFQLMKFFNFKGVQKKYIIFYYIIL